MAVGSLSSIIEGNSNVVPVLQAIGNTSSVIKGLSLFNKIRYGRLYNFYAVVDVNLIAPIGWHVPTYTELNTFRTFVGISNAQDLKATGTEYWLDANGTDKYGFMAVGGGSRPTGSEEEYSGLREKGFYWTKSVTGSAGYILLLDAWFTFFRITSSPKHVPCSIRCVRDTVDGWVEGETITDIDGNVYDTVKIGNQVWTVQNLATTRYRNGVSISEVQLKSDFFAMTTGAYCDYNNDLEIVFEANTILKAKGSLSATINSGSSSLVGILSRYWDPDWGCYCFDSYIVRELELSTIIVREIDLDTELPHRVTCLCREN